MSDLSAVSTVNAASLVDTTTTTENTTNTINTTDNIPQDPSHILAEIERMNVETVNTALLQSDTQQSQQPVFSDDVVPPIAFARQKEPSVADSYINLVNAWKEAEDVQVINVTPTSISNIGQSIGINQHPYSGVHVEKSRSLALRQSSHYQQYQPYPPSPRRSSDIMYESDDSGDEPLQRDLEEKVDAIYNKLCGLVTMDSELVEEIHQFNGGIESLVKTCSCTSKLVNTQVTQLAVINSRMDKFEADLNDIKTMLVALTRGNCYQPNPK